MIQEIRSSEELSACLDVIHQSFATVAEEFGITAANAPSYVGFMPEERLKLAFENGNRMFKYVKDGETVGFVALKYAGEGIYWLERLAVLPEHRHSGIGAALLAHTVTKARESGGKTLQISIIEENTRLKDWYAAKGFIHTGTKVFPHLPFTAGYMERTL